MNQSKLMIKSCSRRGVQENARARVASVSKRVLVQNISYEKDFDLNENKKVGRTHSHVNGFAQRHILIQRQKAIWKCHIIVFTLREWQIYQARQFADTIYQNF